MIVLRTFSTSLGLKCIMQLTFHAELKKKHWAPTSPSKQTPMQILFVSGQCDRDCSNPNFLPTNSLHA